MNKHRILLCIFAFFLMGIAFTSHAQSPYKHSIGIMLLRKVFFS